VLAACDDNDDDVEKMLVDPIMTDAGLVSGIMLGDPENPVRGYRGIPYAAPPMGDLRWTPPQPLEPWDGIRQCTEFSPWALQMKGALLASLDNASEDCLYINLYTPAPQFGQHTEEILLDVGGYSWEEISDLRKHGVI